jgi:deaminated glutathione amidase
MKIAVGQMCSTDDADANFAVVADLVKQASQQGVRLISLPECFEWIGTGPKASVAVAAPLHGPLFTRYRELAKEHNIWCAYGGFHERVDELNPAARIANTHCLVDPAGEIVGQSLSSW